VPAAAQPGGNRRHIIAGHGPQPNLDLAVVLLAEDGGDPGPIGRDQQADQPAIPGVVVVERLAGRAINRHPEDAPFFQTHVGQHHRPEAQRLERYPHHRALRDLAVGRASLDQPLHLAEDRRRDVVRAKAQGIRDNAGQQAGGNLPIQGHAQPLRPVQDAFSRSDGERVNQVGIPEAGIGHMVVEVDQGRAGGLGGCAYLPHPGSVAAVHSNDQIRQHAIQGGAHFLCPRQKGELRRHTIIHRRRHLLAQPAQHPRQAQQRPDCIAIRRDMGHRHDMLRGAQQRRRFIPVHRHPGDHRARVRRLRRGDRPAGYPDHQASG